MCVEGEERTKRRERNIRRGEEKERIGRRMKEEGDEGKK